MISNGCDRKPALTVLFDTIGRGPPDPSWDPPRLSEGGLGRFRSACATDELGSQYGRLFHFSLRDLAPTGRSL